MTFGKSDRAERYAVVALSRAEYAALSAQGYRLSIDVVKTIQANLPRLASPGQVNGIPGYPCYRTVEETYAAAQDIVVGASRSGRLDRHRR